MQCFQETTPTYLQRDTETRSTLKRAKPEEDCPEYLRNKFEPALNHLPLIMGGGQEIKERSERSKSTVPPLFDRADPWKSHTYQLNTWKDSRETQSMRES